MVLYWDFKILVSYFCGCYSFLDDLGFSFYLELGFYSFWDFEVLWEYMIQFKEVVIGVLVLFWYLFGMVDDNGEFLDDLVFVILDIVYQYSIQNWKVVKNFCDVNNFMFIFSVGFGYIDISIWFWNNYNMCNRVNGKYYEMVLQVVLMVRFEIVFIIFFNEWYEGIQIEKVIFKKIFICLYLDYLFYQFSLYLELICCWVEYFIKEKEQWFM